MANFVINIKKLLPAIVALILLLVSSIPINISGIAAFFPAVDIMVIFYWAGYRPDSMPNWFIFILGICRDAIQGLTLGISPCIYLIVKFVVITSRDLYKKESFPVLWQGLVIITILAIAGKWLLISLIMDKPVALHYAMMQVLFSAAIYPLIHWFFNMVYVAMPEATQDV